MPRAATPTNLPNTSPAEPVDAFLPLRLPPPAADAPAIGRSRLLAVPATKEKVGQPVQCAAARGGTKAVHPVRVLTADEGKTRVAYHHTPFAAGGYARVYRGVDVNTGTPVVVKKLTPRNLESFWRDTDYDLQAAALSGSPVAPSHMLTLGTAKRTQVYQVVPWMRGDVFEAVSQLHSRPAGRATRSQAYDLAVHLGQQVAQPLARLHEAKWVHRDIKPDNFLRAPDHRLKLADFGFAAPAGSREAQSLRLSLPYAAPEVLAKTFNPKLGPIDAQAADVYSLGATLMHTCLPHSYPFLASSQADAGLRVAYVHNAFMNTHADLLQDRWPKDSTGRDLARIIQDLAGLRTLVLTMMHPEPQERPSMRQVAKQLQHVDFQPASIREIWHAVDKRTPAPHAQLRHVTRWLEQEAWPTEAADQATARAARLRSRLDALA